MRLTLFPPPRSKLYAPQAWQFFVRTFCCCLLRRPDRDGAYEPLSGGAGGGDAVEGGSDGAVVVGEGGPGSGSLERKASGANDSDVEAPSSLVSPRA
jgi:hypothetical protein